MPSPIFQPVPVFLCCPRLTSKLEMEDMGTLDNLRLPDNRPLKNVCALITSVSRVILTTSPTFHVFDIEGALKRTLAPCTRTL